MTLQDAVNSWPDRESFLQWCRENDIKGEKCVTDCLVAKALKHRTGQRTIFCGQTMVDEVSLPPWMSDVIRDFDNDKLLEFACS